MTIRLFLLQPEVIFQARVNMLTTNWPVDDIVFDTVTLGSYTDIKIGMTVLFGSAAGLDDYGRQRVRRVSLANTLRVGRSSRGNRDGEIGPTDSAITTLDNAYITVLDDYRVWAKIPYFNPATEEVFKDSDFQGSTDVQYPLPKANAGGGYAGTINSSTGLMTVELSGSNHPNGHSWQYDVSNSLNISAPASYLWDVADGTITVGTAASASITVTFPAGFRYVHLTVESDDGQEHTMHVPIFARDPEDDVTITHIVGSQHITPQGQELSFSILQDLPRASYPDGTLAMLWDDALEAPGSRAHMLFVGWHQSDEVGIHSERTGIIKNTALLFVDVAGRLKRLHGFPQRMTYKANPSNWKETRFGNILYYLHYLLLWHSTALEVSDLGLGTQTLNYYEFIELGSEASNLYDQVNSLANAVTPDHHLTCDRQGRLMLVVDNMVRQVANRTTEIRDTLDASDCLEIRYTYERSPRVYQLRAYAVDSTNDYTMVEGIPTIPTKASIAPGDAPGQGEQYLETNERITDSQFSLNSHTGHVYARLNAPYGRFMIRVPYDRLSIDNDPAYMEWMRLTTTSVEPQRGLPFSQKRGLVHEISVAYEYHRGGFSRTATLIWEAETEGPPGVTLTTAAEG